MNKEAMKLALEALEWEEAQTAYPSRMMTNAITALREALAEQPAQPQFVLNGIDCSCGRKWRVTNNTLTASEPEQPAQRKPLTLGQKQRLWSGVGDKPTLKDRVNAYGLAIEAAHGIKENT